MESSALASALASAGFDLFRDIHNHGVPRAVDNLSGRTHYVDPDTRRFFRARVLSSSVLCSGLFFGIIESASANADHSARIFRGVIFDIFGTVVSRPSLENSHKTRKGATAAFWREVDALNPGAHYRERLEKKANRIEAEAEALRAIIKGL